MIHRSHIDWHLTRLYKLNGLQVYFITKRVDDTRNGDLRRSQRTKYWATLPIRKGQILKNPPEIICDLRKREKEFEEVNKTTTNCQVSTQFVLLFE